MKWIKKVATTPLDTLAKVIDNLTQETNNRTNAPSIRAVNEGLANKWADIYPIGSIYLTVDPTFDPSVTFGGTWTQIKDRFLLASGDTYTSGNTGGSATNSYTPAGTVGNHTLTVNEIPSHKHNFQTYNTTVSCEQDGTQIGPRAWVESSDAQTTATGGGGAHNHGFTGQAATINNMPPYLIVNVWKRTA